MMRAAVLLPSLIVAAFAGAAAAQQPATQQPQLSYRGDVAAGCILSAPTIGASTNATAQNASGGSADVVITRLAGDDGVPEGAEVSLVLQAACNQSHTLNLESLLGGLTNGQPAPANGQFRTVLPYQVTLSWAGTTQTFRSDDPALAAAIASAARGSLTVSITIPSGGSPLVAGSYADQLVLELGVAG